MGVYEGRGQLTKAMKDLLLRWQETKMSWDDSISERFEKSFLEPMEKDMRSAIAAMASMGTLLSKIRSDCE